jgi:cysteine desulfurase family protein
MYYLDNAATTWPKPDIVYTTMDTTFRQMFSPKRGTNKASRAGGQMLMEARQTLADLFNIANPERLAFTSGCTHALNLAIQAFPWNPGDGIVISAVEHHALSRPARKMAREKGIELHIVPYSDEEPCSLPLLEGILKAHPNIRMVATTHASNVIGSILPIEGIGALARQHDAFYLVDAAQTAGVVPVDVQAAHIDLLALPGHKSLYGPPGVGALYVADGVPLNTFMEGGTGNDSGLHEMLPTLPDGFEVGTIALPNILAFAAGARWVSEVGLEVIRTHEMQLLVQLMDGLRSLPEVTLYGHKDPTLKTPVLSFNVKGFHPKELGNVLFEDHGIALRAGFHCGPMAHQAIGTLPGNGTLRASLGYFTRPEDVQALVDTLKQILTTSSLTVR